ncbi:MAG: ribonuclease R [Bacilli bacterium]|nr:ribonuclease R [Bacilli bacterium]
MKKRLLEIFQTPNYQPKNFEELFDFLDLKKEQKAELENALSELLDDYEILQSRKKRYILPKSVHIYKGQISIKNPDFGFITSPDFERDFYVSKTDFNRAMDGDKVVFSAMGQYNDSSSFKQEAEVIDIVERNLRFLVGELYQKKGRFFLTTKNISQSVRVIGIVDEYVEGDVVKVEIIDYDKDPIEAKVIEKIGFKNDIGIDILEIAASFNFPLMFSEDTIKEAESLDRNIASEVSKRRKPSLDTIITIDGEDAKDLDDAIGVKKLKNGNYLLGVYIADVSYYVRENGAIDQEAYYRGTSVYLVDRVIPMLPQLLSNDLCSLNPGVLKLVIACEMEINDRGEVVNSEIFPTSIATNYRMTYTNVNKILDNDQEMISRYQDLHQDILLMKEISDVLNLMRNERGALDFDVPEGKIIVNNEGVPVDVVLLVRGVSERIIEEFMLIANETIASRIFHLDLPFIYRIHEEPNQIKLANFKQLSNSLGYGGLKKKVNQKQLQEFLNSVKEEDSFLKTNLLRSMAKAIYNEKNLGHYGLASTCYTHFTAPIRRYPDVIVHRLLRKYLFDHDVKSEELPALNKKIAEIAEQASKKEREAIDCEYRVEDMKKAEYMANFIGEKYDGVISSVTKFGIFVSLPNTIEGLIHIRRMPGRYLYDSNTQSLVGLGSDTYRLGDKVKVEVVKADKISSEIDFDLVYNKDEKKKEEKKTEEKDRRKKTPSNKSKRGKYGESKRRRKK